MVKKIKILTEWKNKKAGEIDYTADKTALELQEKGIVTILDESNYINNLNGFIWDKDSLIQKKVFPMDIHNDFFYYGLLLPKNVEEVNRSKSLGMKQKFMPCLITSNRELLEVNRRLEEDYKLDFENIPNYLPHRWSLEKIKDYLSNEDNEMNNKDLLNKIIKQYEKYLYRRNKVWYKVSALWDIGTYLYMVFEAYPIYELRGLSGTAKTKENTVSSYITFNGGQIMVNPSEATLFRETDEVRGSKYFDEAEKLFVFNKKTNQFEGDVRTELINASYTKEAKVPRQEKIGHRFITKWYSPYSPTRVSSINGLHGATETRSISQITTKSPNDDDRGETEPTEDKNNPIWENIRDECYRFALMNWKDIKELYNNFPKDIGLKKRDFQIWKPLLTIAKFIDEEVYQEILNFAIELSGMKLDDIIPESSFDFMCLTALKESIQVYNHTDKHHLDRIKEIFCKQQNKEDQKNDIYLNRNIGQHLKKLGFDKNRDGNGTYIISDISLFNELISTLCPQLVDLSTSSTSSTHLSYNNKNNSVDSVKIDVDKQNVDKNLSINEKTAKKGDFENLSTQFVGKNVDSVDNVDTSGVEHFSENDENEDFLGDFPDDLKQQSGIPKEILEQHLEEIQREKRLKFRLKKQENIIK